jgi:hypothetical protein
MPHSTLTGADDQPCGLTGHGPIPAEPAREIAADAVWKRPLTDPASGGLLDHGRTTHRPPRALADHVRARDLECGARSHSRSEFAFSPPHTSELVT